jgi:hypothetical protein
LASAQGIETEGQDPAEGLGAEHESPVAESDAPILGSATHLAGGR